MSVTFDRINILFENLNIIHVNVMWQKNSHTKNKVHLWKNYSGINGLC